MLTPRKTLRAFVDFWAPGTLKGSLVSGGSLTSLVSLYFEQSDPEFEKQLRQYKPFIRSVQVWKAEGKSHWKLELARYQLDNMPPLYQPMTTAFTPQEKKLNGPSQCGSSSLDSGPTTSGSNLPNTGICKIPETLSASFPKSSPMNDEAPIFNEVYPWDWRPSRQNPSGPPFRTLECSASGRKRNWNRI
jgi:hypothetical protein